MYLTLSGEVEVKAHHGHADGIWDTMLTFEITFEKTWQSDFTATMATLIASFVNNFSRLFQPHYVQKNAYTGLSEEAQSSVYSLNMQYKMCVYVCV